MKSFFSATRPVILNGIEDIVTRPDLADRAILLVLPPIPERQRRSENALWREFDLARPQILGALLDAAAHGLKMLPRVRIKRLPRMADFTLWVTACETKFRQLGTVNELILTTEAKRSKTSSILILWRRVCASSWPIGRNGREARRICCTSA
jgi:hypothetical protein